MAAAAGGPGERSGAPGRVVAVDLGEVRVGVAVSDSERRLASPYEVLARSGDRTADRAAIGRIVEEVGARTLVVGVPLGLDGRRGRAAEAALEEIGRLREEIGDRLGVEVVGVDERLSTVEADRRRVEALRVRDDARRGGRGGRGGAPKGAGRGVASPGPGRRRRARAVVDDAAAAVFLQSFLDAGARGGRRAGPTAAGSGDAGGHGARARP